MPTNAMNGSTSSPPSCRSIEIPMMPMTMNAARWMKNVRKNPRATPRPSPGAGFSALSPMIGVGQSYTQLVTGAYDGPMETVRRRLAAVLLIGALSALPVAGQSRGPLPASLTDAEFWSLTTRISEPDGFFRSNSGSTDNLLSNEDTISTVAAALATRLKPGGVYLGVGPEQNFTYIAAMRPRIAFITDIRRGNLHLQLLYKALFELSTDRVDFVGRLFTRARPSGLTAASSALAIMNAYRRAAPGSPATFNVNLHAVLDHLKTTRHLPLDADDVAGIEYVYGSFHRFGPEITYTSTSSGRTGFRDYATIATSLDEANGAERTFLANESLFGIVKALQGR